MSDCRIPSNKNELFDYDFRRSFMLELHENRQKAYQYIVELSKILNLDLEHRLDKTINEIDYISLNDLKNLKEGLSDPSQELVSALKKLCSHIASENEINERLVTPFQCNK